MPIAENFPEGLKPIGKINSLDMDIVKYDVYRGPNIGVYISVNDTIGLVPMGFGEQFNQVIESN